MREGFSIEDAALVVFLKVLEGGVWRFDDFFRGLRDICIPRVPGFDRGPQRNELIHGISWLMRDAFEKSRDSPWDPT